MNVDFYLLFFIAFCKSYLTVDNFFGKFPRSLSFVSKCKLLFWMWAMNVSLLLLLLEGITGSSIYGRGFVATGYYTFFKWLLKSWNFLTNRRALKKNPKWVGSVLELGCDRAMNMIWKKCWVTIDTDGEITTRYINNHREFWKIGTVKNLCIYWDDCNLSCR